MIIRVERIGDDGLDVDQVVARAWLEEALGGDSPFTPVGEGRVRLHLLRVEDVIHVRGQATLELGAECSRCLEPVTISLSTPVEVALFPRGAEPVPAADGEIEADDMGVATYDGQEIHLGDLIHDEVFLELPMSPICSQSCAGLCPTCGANLNEGACDCAPAVDHR